MDSSVLLTLVLALAQHHAVPTTGRSADDVRYQNTLVYARKPHGNTRPRASSYQKPLARIRLYQMQSQSHRVTESECDVLLL